MTNDPKYNIFQAGDDIKRVATPWSEAKPIPHQLYVNGNAVDTNGMSLDGKSAAALAAKACGGLEVECDTQQAAEADVKADVGESHVVEAATEAVAEKQDGLEAECDMREAAETDVKADARESHAAEAATEADTEATAEKQDGLEAECDMREAAEADVKADAGESHAAEAATEAVAEKQDGLETECDTQQAAAPEADIGANTASPSQTCLAYNDRPPPTQPCALRATGHKRFTTSDTLDTLPYHGKPPPPTGHEQKANLTA